MAVVSAWPHTWESTWGMTIVTANVTTTYELVLVDRTPNQLTGPTLTDLGPLIAPTITYQEVLNGDGQLQCSVVPDKLEADVKNALRRLMDPSVPPDPLELHLYRDGSKVWAGPLVGWQIQGGTLTLDARGMAYYLRYWWVTSDLTYTATDQYTIAAGLIDHWQSLDYGNFGIDTSTVGTSGTTRTRTYLADEHHNIHEAVTKLSEVSDGFDWWIDADGTLNLSAQRGSDLTSAVVFDLRNITNPGIAGSVAADDIASEAFGLATDVDVDPFTSTRSNPAVRQAFGRAGVAKTFDGVSVQATLDGHTQRLVDDRSGPLFVPGPELIPVSDMRPGDFGPGDTTEWSFDAGLGLQTFDRRLSAVQVSIDQDGGETMSVAML